MLENDATGVALLLWDTSVVISIIFSTFFVTYQAIFNASLIWQWPIIYVGDVIYIIYMVFKFYRSYTDSRGQVIINRRTIVFRTSFLLDLISIIPFEITAVVGNFDDLNYMVAVLRLNRFIRLYRVWMFLCKYTISRPDPPTLVNRVEPVICRHGLSMSFAQKPRL